MSHLSSAMSSLRALRRSPEPVRKKWYRGVSAVTITIVVIGWIFYLSVSLAPPQKPVAIIPEENGFFDTLGKGFEIFAASVTEEWGKLQKTGGALWNGLGAQLANPSVFTFVREETPVVPAAYEPVPPVTLPVSN